VIAGFRRNADEICDLLGIKIRCPETSVKDCHSTLRNIAEERISQSAAVNQGELFSAKPDIPLDAA
jgi:hypothetical protein